MSFKVKIAAGVIGVLAIGGFAVTAAAPASGTTLTCTNINNATVSPFGCGGLQTTPAYNGGPFDITADGNYSNAVIRVDPANVSNQNQDFTAFAVCDGDTNTPPVPAPAPAPTETETLSSDINTDTLCPGDTTGSVGSLGAYVGMFTPLGNIPSFTITASSPLSPPGTTTSCKNATGTYANAVPCAGAVFTAGANTFCLSITTENNGPKGAARWNVVLRPCDTNGEFTYGSDLYPGFVSHTRGNAYQEWAPTDGEYGLELVNVWVYNHGNDEYTLNITGNGGAGTHLIAYPVYSPALNESWDGIGCTPPLTNLVNANQIPASYAFCP